MEWIKVSDRMPPDNERVLTYVPEEFVGSGFDFRIAIHTYYEKYGGLQGAWWIGDQNYLVEEGHITHWMLLPDCPNDEE